VEELHKTLSVEQQVTALHLQLEQQEETLRNQFLDESQATQDGLAAVWSLSNRSINRGPLPGILATAHALRHDATRSIESWCMEATWTYCDWSSCMYSNNWSSSIYYALLVVLAMMPWENMMRSPNLAQKLDLYLSSSSSIPPLEASRKILLLRLPHWLVWWWSCCSKHEILCHSII